MLMLSGDETFRSLLSSVFFKLHFGIFQIYSEVLASHNKFDVQSFPILSYFSDCGPLVKNGICNIYQSLAMHQRSYTISFHLLEGPLVSCVWSDRGYSSEFHPSPNSYKGMQFIYAIAIQGENEASSWAAP